MGAKRDQFMAEKAIKQKEKDDRILHIAEMLARGTWSEFEGKRDLAKKWNVSLSTVAQYATEAARYVRLGPEERDRLRLVLVAECRRVLSEAAQTQSRITGLPDFGVQLQAIDRVAKLEGVDVSGALNRQDERPQKIELTFAPIPPSLSSSRADASDAGAPHASDDDAGVGPREREE